MLVYYILVERIFNLSSLRPEAWAFVFLHLGLRLSAKGKLKQLALAVI